MRKYILDEQGNPVPEPDLLKWARWYENSRENRHVGSTYFGGDAIHVSTVFLSLPHASKDFNDDREMLYETMVFADDAILARLIEKTMCEFIETCLSNGLVTLPV